MANHDPGYSHFRFDLHQPGLKANTPVIALGLKITVEFVTGLSPFQGNTVILTIVDQFFKSVHYVPLSKYILPLRLLVQHIFRTHSIPNDIVSDHGTQFFSQVWQAFCRSLGATGSLTSCYHALLNGQTDCANQDLEIALHCVTSHHACCLACWISIHSLDRIRIHFSGQRFFLYQVWPLI